MKFNNKFEDWLYDLEGFHLLCERIYEECKADRDSWVKIKDWLQAAYEAGYEKAQEQEPKHFMNLQMLTEPVECKSCGAVSVNGGTIHCHSCIKNAYREGYATCLQDYGIWKNGNQYIGCMETHIKDALRKFDESGHADYWAKNFINLPKH